MTLTPLERDLLEAIEEVMGAVEMCCDCWNLSRSKERYDWVASVIASAKQKEAKP